MPNFPHQTISSVRVGALSILPTNGSLVLSTETGDQKIFNKKFKRNKRERKNMEREKEGGRERGQKKAQGSVAQTGAPNNFSTLNSTGVKDPTNCFKQT